ncbi:MAG: dihydroorotase family protein [Candidatus Hadarchaeales archaeon]
MRVQGEGMRLRVSGRIFTPDGVVEGSVTIKDGVISRVSAGGLPEAADLAYHEDDHVVLPGLIDMHVHMRDFEQCDEEDFLSGTGAAAMGGYTVVVDMPNTKPPVNAPRTLAARESRARKRALVDYGLYYGVPNDERGLSDEVQKLALGIKVFMQREYYSTMRPAVLEALNFASKRDLPVIVHAENPAFYVDRGMGPAGTPEAESSAISDISGIADEMGFRLHVTHLSSAMGVRAMRRWRKKIHLTADTCPCYLLLTEKDVRRIGPVAKVHPPIKGGRDRDALVRALRGGSVDAVSSDHAPHLPDEKGNFRQGAPGFPGLETTLPLMLTLVKRGVLRLEDVVRACATAPAMILGLRGLGSIEEGKIGNLTVVDLARRWTVDPRAFVSKAKYTPFGGFEVTGAPVATIVRGRPVMENGRIVGRPGWGRNVIALR